MRAGEAALPCSARASCTRGLRRPQGYPRADVDVAAIRADRHAIISESVSAGWRSSMLGRRLRACALLDGQARALIGSCGPHVPVPHAAANQAPPLPTPSLQPPTKRSPNERPQGADAADGAAAAPAACCFQPARQRRSSRRRSSISSGGGSAAAGSASPRPRPCSSTRAAAPCGSAAALCSGG